MTYECTECGSDLPHPEESSVCPRCVEVEEPLFDVSDLGDDDVTADDDATSDGEE